MIIVALVEGQGEQRAVPLLIRRICESRERFDVQAHAYRSTRAKLSRTQLLEGEVQRAVLAFGADAVLVLFDADDDCAVGLRRQLQPVAESARCPVEIVLAVREYEAWLTAGITAETKSSLLKPNLEPIPDPEAHRGAKEEVEKLMDRRPYSPTAHQAKLTGVIDLQAAERRSRSFRRLVSAMDSLLTAKN
jgi:hypothetical protein